MKFFLFTVSLLLLITDLNATAASTPPFRKSYQPDKAPMIAPPPAPNVSDKAIPHNTMDNFILALASCKPQTIAYTPYGPNKILGMVDNLCHVTFTFSGLFIDCLLPQKIMVTLNQGIDVNQYCSQSRLPLTPPQQSLLKLFSPKPKNR